MVRIKVVKLSQCIKYTVIALCTLALVLICAWLWSGGGSERAQSTQYSQSASLNEPSANEPAVSAFNRDAKLISRTMLASADSVPTLPRLNATLYNALPVAPPTPTATASATEPAESVLEITLSDASTVRESVRQLPPEPTDQAGEYTIISPALDSAMADSAAPEIEVLAQAVPVGAPRILLYHTHTHEAYEKQATDDYVETAQWRTADELHSIVSVGDELTTQLAALGVGVLHDTTDFEQDSLSTSYERSLDMLESYSASGREFEIYIDLHRDAYYAQGSGSPFFATIDGQEVARLMVLIGTGEGNADNGGFAIKPDYEKNLKLAQRLTDELNVLAPDICRPVMVKGSRYNQHVSTNAILIEVGHNRNTLEQAKRAMPYLAQALANVLSVNQ